MGVTGVIESRRLRNTDGESVFATAHVQRVALPGAMRAGVEA